MTGRRALVTAALALFLVACSGAPTSGPSATGPAAVVITESTKGEIQAALQKRQEALSSKDLKGFQSTIDMTRPALRRCQQESFESAARQGAPAQGPVVGKVELYGTSYVRAYVEDASGAGYVRVYFRKDGNNWLVSEPQEGELGGEKTKTVEGLELSYWGIDEDIIDAFGRAGLETRQFLLGIARAPTARPFALRMFPTREAAGLTAACGVVGTARGVASNDPYLRFYRYWTGPDFNKPSETMQFFMRHEGLHWLQEQTVAGINSRMDWWLVEGWPDYIGESRTVSAKSGTICRAPTPTFKELVDGPGADPNVLPERTVQFYSFANTMVEYVYATFGPDAYWNLMDAYKDSVDPKVTYPKVLRVTPEQLYANWLAYAKKKYC